MAAALRGRLSMACVIAASVACGDDARIVPDAAVDAGTMVDAGRVAAAPDLPRLSPCPPGWRTSESAGLPVCDPWPDAEAATCGDGEAHFPGEPGCRTVGSACPAGEWPDDLEAAGVLFVRDGASGGTGSRAAPFGTLAEALAAARPGDIVALSRGTFEGGVVVPAGVTLRGACAAETAIELTVPGALAVVAVEGAGARVRDVRISGAAFGMVARNADPLDVEGVVIDGATGAGLVGTDRTQLSGRDIVVRRTLPDPSGAFGMGILARHGASITIERVVVDGNRSAALSVDEPSTSVYLADAALRRTVEQEATSTLGRGVTLQNGGAVEIERGVIEDNAELGAFASGDGSRLILRDVVVRETRGQLDGRFGRGVAIAVGASATLERVRIEASREAGLHLIDGAHAVATDLVVRDTQPQSADAQFGMGIVVLEAVFEATRVLVAGNRTAGVSLEGDAANATISDLTVRDTMSAAGPQPGWFGRGVNVQRGATALLERALIEGNRDLGIGVLDMADVSLVDVTVADTAERECAASTCAGNGAGTAVAVVVGGRLVARRFVLTRSALAGIQIARDGAADLHDGEVSSNAIGANVQVEGYDVSRLMDGVVYRDNTVTLDSAELPVPEATQ